MSILLVTLLCLGASIPARSSPVTSDADKKMILDAHNKFRSDVSPAASDMVKMYWSDELAQEMEKNTKQCVFAHDTPVVPGWGFNIGQNIAAGGFKDWAAVVAAWHGEVQFFKYDVGSTTPGEAVGHYTQVVQNHAALVGCSVTDCPGLGGKYYGCNYAYGQKDFKHPYTSGSSCGACKSKCKDKLCDCGGKICKNGGKIDLNNCNCKCEGIWGGDDCSTKSCPTKDKGYCGPQYTPDMCAVYSNVPQECPIMCGECPAAIEEDELQISINRIL